MKPHRLLILPALLSALSGCGSIGEGSTLKSLEILPANGSTETSPYTIYQCLRDQLVVIATFSDGTRADFSYRATWTSSDPAAVEVSNNDLPSVFVIDGEFQELANVPYRPGTIVPQAGSGTATITASFLGLSASMDVAIANAALSIAPVAPGVDPNQAPASLAYVGENTTQRFTFFAKQGNRLATLGTINQLGNLTPVRWRFVGGELDVGDDAVPGDFDKYAVPNKDTPDAVIHATTGVVTARNASATEYEVQADTDLCPATSLTTAPIRVLPLATDTPITLAHEENFNGPGVTNDDFISGTSEALRAIANLDLDGNGLADDGVTQDLAGQVALKVTHTTSCTAGEANCVCVNSTCTRNVFVTTGQTLFTVSSTASGEAQVQACFSDADDQTHADDCVETETSPAPTVLLSNVLTIEAIPVDLASGSFQLVAPSPAQEPAFAYPGARFEAYGTFTALNGATPFNGGTSATGTQNLTRLVGWTTRKVGSTTETSDVAFVRRSSDGLFNGIGQMAYSKDVTEDTVVDVSFTAPSLFSASTTLPGPVPFTVCPSTSCSP